MSHYPANMFTSTLTYTEPSNMPRHGTDLFASSDTKKKPRNVYETHADALHKHAITNISSIPAARVKRSKRFSFSALLRRWFGSDPAKEARQKSEKQWGNTTTMVENYRMSTNALHSSKFWVPTLTPRLENPEQGRARRGSFSCFCRDDGESSDEERAVRKLDISSPINEGANRPAPVPREGISGSWHKAEWQRRTFEQITPKSPISVQPLRKQPIAMQLEKMEPWRPPSSNPGPVQVRTRTQRGRGPPLGEVSHPRALIEKTESQTSRSNNGDDKIDISTGFAPCSFCDTKEDVNSRTGICGNCESTYIPMFLHSGLQNIPTKPGPKPKIFQPRYDYRPGTTESCILPIINLSERSKTNSSTRRIDSSAFGAFHSLADVKDEPDGGSRAAALAALTANAHSKRKDNLPNPLLTESGSVSFLRPFDGRSNSPSHLRSHFSSSTRDSSKTFSFVPSVYDYVEEDLSHSSSSGPFELEGEPHYPRDIDPLPPRHQGLLKSWNASNQRMVTSEQTKLGEVAQAEVKLVLGPPSPERVYLAQKPVKATTADMKRMRSHIASIYMQRDSTATGSWLNLDSTSDEDSPPPSLPWEDGRMELWTGHGEDRDSDSQYSQSSGEAQRESLYSMYLKL